MARDTYPLPLMELPSHRGSITLDRGVVAVLLDAHGNMTLFKPTINMSEDQARLVRLARRITHGL